MTHINNDWTLEDSSDQGKGLTICSWFAALQNVHNSARLHDINDIAKQSTRILQQSPTFCIQK